MNWHWQTAGKLKTRRKRLSCGLSAPITVQFNTYLRDAEFTTTNRQQLVIGKFIVDRSAISTLVINASN
jgi:hypothetical protein